MLIDIIIFILVTLTGLVFPNIFGIQLSWKDKSNLRKIWFFHLLISIYICLFGVGDAINYWETSKKLNFDQFLLYIFEAKGTYFMWSLNYIPAGVLNLSYFSGTILYSLIGYIGIVFFYFTAIKIIPYNSKFKGYTLIPLLFFMPNLHYWSSAIGKDTILFMCIGMFVFAMLEITKRAPLLIFSLLLSYLVRPHITFFLIISFSFAFLFESKISGLKRVILSLLLIGAGLAILPMVMEYAKIEDVSLNEINQFSESQAILLSQSNTGSRIDISSYPLPLKIITFLYRPFFFDINGIPAIIASLENLVLLILSIKVLRNKPFATFKAAPFAIKGLVLFLIIGTLAFSQSLGNLGIMLRMRNMFLPGMLLFILWSFSYQRQKRI